MFSCEDEQERLLWLQALCRATGQSHRPLPPPRSEGGAQQLTSPTGASANETFTYLHQFRSNGTTVLAVGVCTPLCPLLVDSVRCSSPPPASLHSCAFGGGSSLTLTVRPAEPPLQHLLFLPVPFSSCSSPFFPSFSISSSCLPLLFILHHLLFPLLLYILDFFLLQRATAAAVAATR